MSSFGDEAGDVAEHRAEVRAARVRRAAAVAAVVGAVLSVSVLLLGPIAKSVALSRARDLGVMIDVQSSSVGFFFVRLRGVAVSAPELPGISATLDRIDVFPSFGIRTPRVEVHGGRVRIRGSLDDIERQLSAREPRKSAAANGGSERVTRIVADGIDVVWTRGAKAGDSDCAWGVRYERTADARESLGADLVQASMGNLGVQVVQGRAAFRKNRGKRLLDSVSTERISGTFRLEGDGDDISKEEQNPPRAQKDVRVPEGSSPDRGERLRAELGRWTASAASALVPPATMSLSGVRLELTHGDERLNIGPASVGLTRDPNAIKLTFVPTAREATTPLRFEATVPVGGGPVDVDLVGGPVSLSALGVKEKDMGLLDVDRAEVEVAGHARWSEDGRAMAVSGHARVGDLSIHQPKLGPEPVRGVGLTFDGDGSFALDGSRIDLAKVNLLFGKIKLDTHGVLERQDGYSRGRLHVAVPLAACSDVLASTPSALVPLLRGLEGTGTLAFSGDLEFDTRRPGDTRIAWDFANECRVTRVPENLSPEKFRRPWSRTVLAADGSPVTVDSGPGTDTWVPYAEISPFMQTAIVVCEDSRFFQHDGFDAKAIQESIKNNLRAGSFVRGGSTVSMQLAKNLYLGREKTLSRKLQEAVLTLLLEQVLSKEQILELYLNVIEFAPGVYGIGPAASYYFRSLPRDLSLGQALYLGSILPNPKNRHFSSDGALSERWSEYLRKLMVIAHKIRRVDDHTLALGLAETVRFGVAADPGAAAGAEGDNPPDVIPPEDSFQGAEGP
jgi:hypothetical protein